MECESCESNVENPETVNADEPAVKAGKERQQCSALETEPEPNAHENEGQGQGHAQGQIQLTAQQRAFIVESAKVEMNIRMIMSNTTYSREEAARLLNEHRSAEEVVRRYLGVVKDDKKKLKKSVNQEIFRQIRSALDSSCDEYRKRNPLQLNDVVHHFQEQEEMVASK